MRKRQRTRQAPRDPGTILKLCSDPKTRLLIGDAATVAEQILYVNEVLGDFSRITFQTGILCARARYIKLLFMPVLAGRTLPITNRGKPHLASRPLHFARQHLANFRRCAHQRLSQPLWPSRNRNRELQNPHLTSTDNSLPYGCG